MVALKSVVAVAALLTFTLPAGAITISNDNGGSVWTYYMEAQKHTNVRIIGNCFSACTLYLRAQNVCVTEKAALGFHKVYGSTKQMNDLGQQLMMREYPSKIKNWIKKNGGLTSNLKILEAPEIFQYFKKCK